MSERRSGRVRSSDIEDATTDAEASVGGLVCEGRYLRSLESGRTLAGVERQQQSAKKQQLH
jgi:hypothetical protein